MSNFSTQFLIIVDNFFEVGMMIKYLISILDSVISDFQKDMD